MDNVRRKYKIPDEVESCNELVRRIPRYSIKLRAVRSLLGELRCIR